MNKYQSYKSSGVEWIGKIPDNWSVSKFKYLTKKEVQYGVNSSSDNYIESGIRFIRTTDILESGELIEEGVYVEESTIHERQFTELYDFLISRSGTLGRTYLHLNSDKYTYGGYLVRFNFGSESLSKFIDYYCKSTSFSSWITLNTIVSTIGNVNGQKYSNMELPLPPLKSISEIVQFLDEKTELIDKLISTKERKITLLKEQRILLMNQVVTKGLNPNVKMKDSGVEWIGEIPEQWELKPLKYLIKNLNSGVSVNSENVPVEDEIELGVLKTSCVYGDIFRPNENKKVVIEEISRVNCPVLKDSIIISRMNTPELVGSSGYVYQDYSNLFLPDRLWITEFKEDVNVCVKFYSYILKSDIYKKTLSSKSTGTSSSMKNISKNDLLSLPVPYFDLKEQYEITMYLDELSHQGDDLIHLEQKKIDLLKEYRQSLISEVVTGKIKVTTNE